MIPRLTKYTSMVLGGLPPHSITLVSPLDMFDLLNCHDRSIKDPGKVFSRCKERPEPVFTFFKRDAIRLSIKSYISLWRSFPVHWYTLKELKKLTELKWLG